MTVASQATLPSTVATPCSLDRGGAPVEDGDFDAELIAGNDGAAEAGVVDAGEDHELGVAVGENSVSRSAPPAWAMASTMRTPGMMGKPGKWPWKCGSLMVTFLMATMRWSCAPSR